MYVGIVWRGGMYVRTLDKEVGVVEGRRQYVQQSLGDAIHPLVELVHTGQIVQCVDTDR